MPPWALSLFIVTYILCVMTAVSEKASEKPPSPDLKEKKDNHDSSKDEKLTGGLDPYETHQLGVFRTHIFWGNTNTSVFNLKAYFTEIFTGYMPTLYRLLSEIYSLAPFLLVVYFLSTFWIGISQAVEMTIASQALRSVSVPRIYLLLVFMMLTLACCHHACLML